uniref:Uncharacterized protein n=1 Tax=Buteo japonicus TaxID=224669 RepID=A0A8C0BIY9_9AVES
FLKSSQSSGYYICSNKKSLHLKSVLQQITHILLKTTQTFSGFRANLLDRINTVNANKQKSVTITHSSC